MSHKHYSLFTQQTNDDSMANLNNTQKAKNDLQIAEEAIKTLTTELTKIHKTNKIITKNYYNLQVQIKGYERTDLPYAQNARVTRAAITMDDFINKRHAIGMLDASIWKIELKKQKSAEKEVQESKLTISKANYPEIYRQYRYELHQNFYYPLMCTFGKDVAKLILNEIKMFG